jgi:DNA polymerase III sliding clamp (beta) subunit (PCNA family)
MRSNGRTNRTTPEVSMLLLPKNVSRLADLVSRGAGRQNLSGIRVLEYADGYRLEATDGKRLLVVRGPQGAETTPQDRLTRESLADAPDAAFDALVPADDWSKAFKAAKKGENVGVALSAIEVTLAAGTQTLKARSLDGQFPDVNVVLPKKPALWSVAFNPVLMAELLMAMAAIAGEDACRVSLHFYGADRPLGLSCSNAAGQFADALLVPLQ